MDRQALDDDIRVFSVILTLLRDRVGPYAREFQGEAWVRISKAREALTEADELPDTLEEFCAPHVLEAVARVRYEHNTGGSRSGVFGTHLDAQLKPIPPDARIVDKDFDESLLWERAFEKATPTMKRNLEWWKLRKLSGQMFSAIAEEHPEAVAESTVRGGVARAEKFLRKVQDELVNQPWEAGEINFDDVHDAYRSQDQARFAAELDKLRPFDRQPVLLNYQGILHLWRGELEEAREVLEQALVFADEAGLRCLITNNLGNVDEELGELDAALYWFDRARQLNPRSPTPLLNLLGIVCQRASPDFEMKDRARVLHYIDCITKLLSSKQLEDGDRRYLLRRLKENPVFGPARRNTCWKRIRAWLQRSSDLLETTSDQMGAAQ
jgi:tetratricopeptide (TPR) repeat protein